MTMKQSLGNIYKNARQAAGLTQERWAECLGISAESVRQYEAGIIMPGEDVLLMMADISGMKILPYWHLSQKSRIASRILPELEEQKGLPEAVLALLIQIDDFREDGLRRLTRIAADGKISEDEEEDYQEALRQITELVRRAYALGYAETEEEP